jgi:UDPglucose 6-dehydrogenase
LEAIEGCDALAVVTEWKEFRTPNFVALAEALRDRAIFDGRNIYDPTLVEAMGLHYYGIGRSEQAARSSAASQALGMTY